MALVYVSAAGGAADAADPQAQAADHNTPSQGCSASEKDGGDANCDRNLGCVGGSSGTTLPRVRLHMRMYSDKHHWGILNLTGRLVDWSFTRDLAAAHAASKVRQ